MSLDLDLDLVRRLCRELSALERESARLDERATAAAERLHELRREQVAARVAIGAKIDELVAAARPGGAP